MPRRNQSPTRRRRRGRVRVRRGDQHPVYGNPGLLLRRLLALVHERTGNQKVVDHDDDNLRGAVVQHQASGVQRVDHLLGPALQRAPADDDGQLRRRNVHGKGPRPKDLFRTWLSPLRPGDTSRDPHGRKGYRRYDGFQSTDHEHAPPGVRQERLHSTKPSAILTPVGVSNQLLRRLPLVPNGIGW